jgi:membrane protease YdiL (CAAX protease family)
MNPSEDPQEPDVPPTSADSPGSEPKPESSAPQGGLPDGVAPVVVSPAVPQSAAEWNVAPPPVEPNPFDVWLASNAVPLLVTSLSIVFLLTAMLAAPLLIHKRPMEAAPHGSTNIHETPIGPGTIRFGASMFMLVALVLFASPRLREWLLRFTRRAMPALRGLDVVAVLAVFFTAINVISIGAYIFPSYADLDPGMKIIVHLLINDASMLIGLVCAILLARSRARAPHGSLGIWPFWTLIDKDRPFWKDLLLGVACFPCVAICLNTLIVPLSRKIMEALGKRQDQNPIIDQLLLIHGGWQLALVVITVSLGAAFFEELLFRGVLYNVLRRYLGPLGGALIAAFLFAGLHGTLTEFMALFVLALVLTWLYERTGRLVASMALHAVNNAMALLALWALHSGIGKN